MVNTEVMKTTTTQEIAMNTAASPRFAHDAATIRSLTWLDADLRRHADKADQLADAIADWDLSPRSALGLIQRGQDLSKAAASFAANPLIGPNTRASFRNRQSATSVEYGLMYALGEVEKYRTGQYQGDDDTKMARSTLTVQAAGLRCHASGCRVIAQIATEVAAGDYLRIG